MIRFLIAGLFLILFLIIAIPTFLAIWLIGFISRSARDILSLSFAKFAFTCIQLISGVKLTVIGEENIPDEAVLYVGNHRSIFDIILTYSRVKRLTGYVAKKSLGDIPVFSNVMGFLYCLFLDRNDTKQGLKTILQAIDYINQGISIFIFPEGSRNKGEEGTVLPFKDGAFKVSTKTNCAIIPVSFNNTADVFESHFPILKPRKVVIEYGTPIYPNDLPPEVKKKIGPYVHNIIEETISKNQELIENDS